MEDCRIAEERMGIPGLGIEVKVKRGSAVQFLSMEATEAKKLGQLCLAYIERQSKCIYMFI